jgi:hypothetical protein
MGTSIVYNDKIAYYIKQKLNELEGTNHKPLVIVLYDAVTFPEIPIIIDYIGGVDQATDYSDPDPEIQSANFIRELNVIKNTYPTQSVALMAGMYTSEAFTAQTIMGNDRPNIHLMSGASTYNGQELKVLRAMHCDNLASVALVLFTKTRGCNTIHICAVDSLYGNTLQQLVIEEATLQNINYVTHPYNVTGLTLSNTDLCFAIMNGADMEQLILNNNFSNSFVVGSDLAFDYNGSHPDIKSYVMVQAPEDVTTTTIDLYKYIYDNLGYTKNVSQCGPFIYDLLVRSKLVNNFEDITKILNGNLPPAALVSVTYATTETYPLFGGYWFIQTYPDPNIIINRMTVNGSSPTLMCSASAELLIQHFVWAGAFQWCMYYNAYEEAHINDEVINRHLYQSTDILNWSPIHVNLGKIDNRWKVANYTYSYPLDSTVVINTYT